MPTRMETGNYRNPDSRVISERQTSCYGSMLLHNKLDMDQRPLST